MKKLIAYKSNYLVFIVFAILFAPLLFASTYMGLGIYILPVVVAMPVAFFVIKYPKLWIYVVIFSYPLFAYTRSEGLSAFDFFFAVLLQGGTLVWIFSYILIQKKKLVRNLGDMMILFWFLCMIGNCMVAMLNGVEFLSWLSEVLLSLTILLYFPIRVLFSDKEDLKKLLLLMGGMLTISALYSFYQYYLGLSDLEYAYQLASTNRSNLMAFTSGVVFGLVLIFYQEKRFRQWVLIVYTGTLMFALIFSLARTNWVILILDSILLFTFLPFKKKLQMTKVFSGIFIIAIIALFTLLGDYSDLFFTAITKRFQSSTEGKKDISIVARIVEYKEVFSHIKENPISGNGMAKKIFFQDPITQAGLTTATIHNGYLSLAYRTGIPMMLLYLYFFFSYLMKSFWLIFRLSGFWKALSLAAFLSMLSIAIANIMSQQFFYRDAFYAIFMTIAVISIIEYNNPPTTVKATEIEL